MALRTLIALACLMLTDALRTAPRARPPVMMAKKVAKLQNVLLEADVEGLGKTGQIVQVKAAYANNVLVAKRLGSVASKETVAQIAKSEAEAIAAFAEAKKKAIAAKAELEQRYAKAGMVFEVQVAKDGSIAAVGSEAVAAEISRSGTPVLAANVKMDEITELGASAIATVALHEEVEMQVKVEVIKSKITISYG